MKNSVRTRQHCQFILSALSALIAVCVLSNPAAAQQTTAFTYQGKLTDAGSPANANYDLQFKLFDNVTVGAGTQQGATLVRNPVTASVGVFAVQLDFGANVFNGADRYLEIGVRPAGNSGAYTVLAPRQPITASPYAIQTLNAQQLGGLPASGFVQNTATPQAGANFNIDGSGTVGSLNDNGAMSLGGIPPPVTAPAGQGRIYFDAASNKVKVSENGAAFVNLLSGVSGSGTVNSIPFWSAGTVLGNSGITQSVNGVQLPNGVQLGLGAQGNQVQFGSPNSETGMSISGFSGRADLRFDGLLKLVNGTGGIPPATNGIAINTAGNVGIGTTTPSYKLHVLSATSPGFPTIYGENVAGPGVWGKSTSSQGVVGISTSESGVYGETAVSSLTAGGVYGRGTGSGSIGVIGESNISNAVGVFGVSTSTAGVGVYARNLSGGRALFVEGDAGQSRDRGGLVKAMAYIQGSIIIRCFNSQLAGSAASTAPCGFSVNRVQAGFYEVQFGFTVSDRFFSVTPIYGTVFTMHGPNAGANIGFNSSSTALNVLTFRTDDASNTLDADFIIFVY